MYLTHTPTNAHNYSDVLCWFVYQPLKSIPELKEEKGKSDQDKKSSKPQKKKSRAQLKVEGR